MSIRLKSSVVFLDRDIIAIVRTINLEVVAHRSGLLPNVLREWAAIDVKNAGAWGASSEYNREKSKKYKMIAGSASDLRQIIQAVTEMEDLDLIVHVFSQVNPPILANECRNRFNDHLEFLDNLEQSANHLGKRLKRSRGQPRNTAAYLVLLDLAAIFEWLTGVEPKRNVSRTGEGEIGTFYPFCEAVWPLVFDGGLYGLHAAMKNWARDHAKYVESSAVIANIHLRHPSWGLFRQ
jgi:hypothetical protein